MPSPSVSVVMSVCNGQAYLSEAVESILNQTLRDFEFIIIDDGSTDRTGEILSTCAKRDPRIRIITHENKGRATSLNIGIAAARSNYIARMDADDVALPYRLQEQFSFMIEHSEVGALGAAVELIARTGERISETHPPTEDFDIRQALQCGNPMWHPTVMLRKDVALKAGGYRQALRDCDDYDLFLRIIEHAQIANLNTVVLRYRVHTQQVSVTGMRHQAECLLAAQAAARSRSRGLGDPLCGVDQVTPGLLHSMGVNEEDLIRVRMNFNNHWMRTLKRYEPEASMRAASELLRMSDFTLAPRWLFADAWLTLAEIHLRQHRPGKALLCAMRALQVRPTIAVRPFKRIMRLAYAKSGTTKA